MPKSRKIESSHYCPACGSTNIQSEPLYPYEDEYDYGYDEDEMGDLAVFCVSCGHYLGEMKSELTSRMQDFRRELGDWLPHKDEG